MKMRKLTKTCLTAISVALPFAAAAGAMQSESVTDGYADIISCDDGSVIGSATLLERPSDEGIKTVEIRINVWGLNVDAAGKHAVHIHETGQCSPSCGDAGGHFDPGPYGNTTPPDENHPFHAGDLVNINLNENGYGSLWVTTTRVTLSDGPLSIFDEDGSAFIIHEQEDTYCPDGNVPGCAGGARAACGIIYPGSGS